MDPQRLDELNSPPVIGRTYLVPHVQVWGRDWFNGQWVPVRGPVHTDPELGASKAHLHYDERFVQQAMKAELLGSGVRNLSTYLLRVHTDGRTDPGATYNWTIGSMEWIPAVCRRVHGTFLKRARGSSGNLRREYREWCKGYEGSTLTPQGHCPHRGFNMNQVRPDKDGIKMCPLHGLRWCAKTGKNIPLTAKPALK